jgi:hypothetical protein
MATKKKTVKPAKKPTKVSISAQLILDNASLTEDNTVLRQNLAIADQRFTDLHEAYSEAYLECDRLRGKVSDAQDIVLDLNQDLNDLRVRYLKIPNWIRNWFA